MILFEPFRYDFFVRGLLAATLVGGLCGLVGVYIVLRRMSYIGHGLSHAVFGGAGAEERWYEIDPIGSAPSVFQSGVATSATLYVWNGAVSPDRAVGPAGSAFGSNMVMGFNTSSSQEFSAIQMVSKIAANPQSPFVLVTQSSGNNVDFSCRGTSDPCRWGDYSGAVPDPAASLTGTTGQVWLSNEWKGGNWFTRYSSIVGVMGRSIWWVRRGRDRCKSSPKRESS